MRLFASSASPRRALVALAVLASACSVDDTRTPEKDGQSPRPTETFSAPTQPAEPGDADRAGTSSDSPYGDDGDGDDGRDEDAGTPR